MALFRKKTDIQELRRSGDVQGLLKALESKNPETRMEAARAFAAMHELPSPVLAAMTSALRDEFQEVRVEAASALATAAHDEALPDEALVALQSCLADESPKVRAMAARVLGHAKNASASNSLLKLLTSPIDPDPQVRAESARALGAMKVREAIQPLLRLVGSHLYGRGDPDMRVKSAACSALGAIGEQLVSSDEDYDFNRHGETKQMVDALSEAVFRHDDEGSNDNVRKSALSALGRLGAVAPIARTIERESSLSFRTDVIQAAKQAMEQARRKRGLA